MDDILDSLLQVALRCEQAARRFADDEIRERRARLQTVIEEFDRAWSRSWVGYHARIYIQNFRPRRAGETWSAEWGPRVAILSRPTAGEWAQYSDEQVLNAILERANVPEDQLRPLQEAAHAACAAFDDAQQEILPTIDALVVNHNDEFIRKCRSEISDLQSHRSAEEFLSTWMPKETITRDQIAAGEGLQAPPHLQLKAQLLEQSSYGTQVGALAKKLRYIEKYLRMKLTIATKTRSTLQGKIFIGHGQSMAWRDLKDFLQDRLELPWDEYNREPTAGFSTKERLQQMLNNASFAFLVMTAEDERADGRKTARANVIHEAGLFQGRFGFERAIVLLEDGCEEFSNIVGITQLRFPAGNIKSVFEEIRRILEREHIMPRVKHKAVESRG